MRRRWKIKWLEMFRITYPKIIQAWRKNCESKEKQINAVPLRYHIIIWNWSCVDRELLQAVSCHYSLIYINIYFYQTKTPNLNNFQSEIIFSQRLTVNNWFICLENLFVWKCEVRLNISNHQMMIWWWAFFANFIKTMIF